MRKKQRPPNLTALLTHAVNNSSKQAATASSTQMALKNGPPLPMNKKAKCKCNSRRVNSTFLQLFYIIIIRQELIKKTIFDAKYGVEGFRFTTLTEATFKAQSGLEMGTLLLISYPRISF